MTADSKLIEEYLRALVLTIFTHQCSANQGDSSDRVIDNENREANDFMILVCLGFTYLIFIGF